MTSQVAVRGLCLLAVGCATGTPDRVAQDLPRHLTDDRPPYTVSIQRIAASDMEYRLLRVAESLPPRFGACDEYHSPCDWWQGDFDGTRIAVTANGDALRYYLQKIEDFENGRWLTTSHGIKMLGAKLVYVARVSLERREGQRAFRVHLSLEFDQYCGNVCALWIKKERTVWLTEDGKLLRVEGDSPSDYSVS